MKVRPLFGSVCHVPAQYQKDCKERIVVNEVKMKESREVDEEYGTMVQSKSITKESKESLEEKKMTDERKFEHRLEERDIDVLHNQANPN